jgi:glutamine amidotransferase
VARLPSALPLPHVGFNSVQHAGNSPLFTGITTHAYFYFTHSYAFCAEDPAHRLGLTDYGTPFTSAVSKGALYGVQFHPEKSQAVGLQLLKNFVELC